MGETQKKAFDSGEPKTVVIYELRTISDSGKVDVWESGHTIRIFQ